MAEFALIYTTLPDAGAARAMGEALVTARLAACVNFFAPMTSIYEWKSEVTAESEVAMLIKTRDALADAAIAFARDRHPYETPCFLKLPIEGGDAPYLDWLRAQTKVTP